MRLFPLVSLALLACSSDPGGIGGGGGAGGGAASSGAQTSGQMGSGGASSVSSASTTTGAGGAAPGKPDPNEVGPYAVASKSAQATVPATSHTFAVKAFYPSAGPTTGGYPVVVIGHGFQLPASQYEGYAERLASFGYVAVTADFPASFLGNKHTDNAKDLLGAADWAMADPELSPIVDATRRGLVGHSLGGKAALLAATMSQEIDAVVALDPVDGSMNCSPTDCPDVSALMPTLAIPTLILGETLDASGGFQPCAPAADNFATFYAGAQSPSISVEVLGANHMSFLDDPGSCGFTCSFCNAPTLAHETVIDLAYAYTAAFFERRLRDDADYETFLTGAVAQERYVNTGYATILSK